MASLTGKTALITGGSKGIGAAAALLLAKNGANVAINYSSDASAAEEIVKQIGGDRSIAIKGDAGSLPDVWQDRHLHSLRRRAPYEKP